MFIEWTCRQRRTIIAGFPTSGPCVGLETDRHLEFIRLVSSQQRNAIRRTARFPETALPKMGHRRQTRGSPRQRRTLPLQSFATMAGRRGGSGQRSSSAWVTNYQHVCRQSLLRQSSQSRPAGQFSIRSRLATILQLRKTTIPLTKTNDLRHVAADVEEKFALPASRPGNIHFPYNMLHARCSHRVARECLFEMSCSGDDNALHPRPTVHSPGIVPGSRFLHDRFPGVLSVDLHDPPGKTAIPAPRFPSKAACSTICTSISASYIAGSHHSRDMGILRPRPSRSSNLDLLERCPAPGPQMAEHRSEENCHSTSLASEPLTAAAMPTQAAREFNPCASRANRPCLPSLQNCSVVSGSAQHQSQMVQNRQSTPLLRCGNLFS